MRLPRRVPWASITELDEVCSWIFGDDSDIQSQALAVQRLSAWGTITTLPHALESTLALLTVILQDHSSPSTSSFLHLRQSYAAAILRLVNGLVDPLQLGVYARSIASIAAQLGLPSWLVELRHAATHEDLPSLQVLREAAKESMSWLLHNYFLPTLNPLIAPRPQPTLRPLTPSLKKYKSLVKATIRDASTRNHHKSAINSTLRDIERWMAEAKVAANMAIGEFDWDAEVPYKTEVSDVREGWALDKLCDILLENGVLVPLSKKKRIFPEDSFSPSRMSLLLWTPLLEHLQSHHPDLRSTLSNRIVSRLLEEPVPVDQLTHEPAYTDPSFDMCIARWAWWMIDPWDVDDDATTDLKRDIVSTLVTALGPRGDRPNSDKNAAKSLLTALCSGNQSLEAALSLLLPSSGVISTSPWTSDAIDVMHHRLTTLLSSNLDIQPPDPSPSIRPCVDAVSHKLPLGWRLLDTSSSWNPCPIGVYASA